MAKDKGGKCRAHVRRCLVELEPITKETIVKSGSTISEYTRAMVLGLGRLRRRPRNSPIKHAIYPDKTMLQRGEVETVETLRHQVENQLEIINKQDIQIIKRDIEISSLRIENKKLKEKACRQVVKQGRVSKTLEKKLAVPPKTPFPSKTISNSSPRSSISGKNPPSVQIPEKSSPKLPMKTITLILPSHIHVKTPRAIRTTTFEKSTSSTKAGSTTFDKSTSSTKAGLTTFDKSTSSTKAGSVEPPVNGATKKSSRNEVESQTVAFPKTIISVISPPPVLPLERSVSVPKPIKRPVHPKRVLTPEPKEILYSDRRRSANWTYTPTPSARTRQIHRSYKAQLKGNIDTDDGRDADYEVESEESEIDEESDELPDDIDAEPCFGLRTSSRKSNVEPVPEVRVPSPKPPVIRNRPRIQRRKFPKDKMNRKKSTFEKLLEENTLSRPTLAERLPMSLRSKLESELSGNSQFRALVNLKRAQIDQSKQRLLTSKVLCPLLSKNRQIGLGNGKTAIGIEKIRDRKRTLSNFKKASSVEETELKSPSLPEKELHSEALPVQIQVRDKRRATLPWISQMIFSKERKFIYTLEPYHIASLPTNPAEADDSIPSSEHIEVPNWRRKTFPPSYRENGLESVDDMTYLKRHLKGEEDEKRRKRWDAQKLREETYVEYLRIRQAKRSTSKPTSRKEGHEENAKFGCESFHPDPMGALHLQIQDEIPINIFGCGLPIMDLGCDGFRDFELPMGFLEANMQELKVQPNISVDPTPTAMLPPNKVPGRATAVPFLGKKRMNL